MSESKRERSKPLSAEEHLQRWEAEAAKVKEDTSGVPCSVALQEASGLVRFVREYQEPAADGSRPGLKQVAKLIDTEALAVEMESLIEAGQFVQTRVLYPDITEEGVRQKLSRAQQVTGEVGAALEFVLDDDIYEPADDAFAAAKERAQEDETQAGLAQQLADYAYIGEEKKETLAKIEGFDLGLLGEALDLSEFIRQQGTPQPGRPASEDVALRNRLLFLLRERVKKVRQAFRFVFREHPHIARLASSAYQRRKRLAARRKKLQTNP